MRAELVVQVPQRGMLVGRAQPQAPGLRVAGVVEVEGQALHRLFGDGQASVNLALPVAFFQRQRDAARRVFIGQLDLRVDGLDARCPPFLQRRHAAPHVVGRELPLAGHDDARHAALEHRDLQTPAGQ